MEEKYLLITKFDEDEGTSFDYAVYKKEESAQKELKRLEKDMLETYGDNVEDVCDGDNWFYICAGATNINVEIVKVYEKD